MLILYLNLFYWYVELFHITVLNYLNKSNYKLFYDNNIHLIVLKRKKLVICEKEFIENLFCCRLLISCGREGISCYIETSQPEPTIDIGRPRLTTEEGWPERHRQANSGQ